MNILILSCNTGGGHNAAANALAEEIRSHGDTATVLDYFCLADSRISHTVGNVYVEIVKKVPALFGFIYQLGMFVSHLVPKSPVYYTNGIRQISPKRKPENSSLFPLLAPVFLSQAFHQTRRSDIHRSCCLRHPARPHGPYPRL